ncbi:MAG: diguanylate cyclase [Eubacteriales bacterium]|nr:diguanylate cyclase [Eubacteriales bacterium]
MKRFKFSDLISSNTFDKNENLKSENRLACIFGSLLMITGSIASFISLYYIMHENISDTWPGSLIMFIMGIALIIILRLLKNENTKMHLFAAIFAAYLILVVLQYYSYIGPAVWTISLTITMISILYGKKRMLFIIASTITLLVIYSAYKNIGLDMWEFYYAAQVVTLIIIFIVIRSIHSIILNRANKIHEQYNEIYKSEEKLNLTLRSVGDGVITVDAKGIIEFINPVGQNLTGWFKEEGVGESFENVFKIVNEYTREKVESPVALVFEKKQIIELANHTILISKNGKEKPVEDTAAPILDKSGNISGAVLVFRDFSEKKEKQKRIEYLSYHDQLTGLYNRRFFEEELIRLDTKRNLPLSIIYADVNGLKIINDAFGHERGDELIQWVADALKTICRSDDIIARIGGDEFVILLPGTDAVSAEKLAIRIIEKIEQRKIADINISVSFGWDTKNEDDQLILDILKNAEDSMYQKKLLNSTSNRSGIIRAIHSALFIKCLREEVHSKRVGAICKQIGQAYQLNADEMKELTAAGELHDIGKIAIDEAILNKPGSLSKSEWAQIKHHPETGYRLLSTDKEFINIAEYIFAHHERWDGIGYPKGLKGEAINWQARVIALAEAYDAMTSECPYRSVLSKEQAIAEIKKNSGTQFDPEIAQVFLEKVLGIAW